MTQREKTDIEARSSGERHQDGNDRTTGMYLRFGAMILTAMVVMYWTMYLATWEWGHVQWSESRFFMTLAMGGTMGLIMLGWMLNMYKNTRINIGIALASVALLVLAVFLDRSQTTVQDNSFMSGMIPHHSLAITRAERSELSDVRVCRLAVDISEAQKREIAEMHWLISDIEENGIAATVEEADARPVPDFEGDALRQCPG